MSEVIAVMDIDDENGSSEAEKSVKGKTIASPAAAPDGKAIPWVEKFRPKSLADVAAHRDIVDTSKTHLHHKITLLVTLGFSLSTGYSLLSFYFTLKSDLGLVCSCKISLKQ